MNFTLTRNQIGQTGIFGTLNDESGNQIAVTLEHAFDTGDAGWSAKIAPGVYTCLRHPPVRFPFVTWELQNVPDFQNEPVSAILIHPGNYNSDSDGCILVGDERNGDMIMNSKVTLGKFMDLTSGLDSITLVVI
jgi:hypothetical protein